MQVYSDSFFCSEAVYGRILGPFLDDPANLIIASSDFCHWGARFSYTFVNQDHGPIWKSIQWLDELGIEAIKTVGGFEQHCST